MTVYLGLQVPRRLGIRYAGHVVLHRIVCCLKRYGSMVGSRGSHQEQSRAGNPGATIDLLGTASIRARSCDSRAAQQSSPLCGLLRAISLGILICPGGFNQNSLLDVPLVLREAERLPSRYKAALPLALAARPFLSLILLLNGRCLINVLLWQRLWYTSSILKLTAQHQSTTLSPQRSPVSQGKNAIQQRQRFY